MALQSVPPFLLGAFYPALNNYGAFTAQTFDATTDLAVWIFQAPKTGTLDRMDVNIAAITTWPSGGVQVGWQGVTETAVPTVNNGSFTHSVTVTASPGAGWWNPGSFVDGGAAKKSVTQGDLIAFVMKPVSGTVSFTVNRIDSTNLPIGGGLIGKFPMYLANTSGTTAISATGLSVALWYDGDSAPTSFSPHAPPVLAMTTKTVASTNPDYAGLLFRVPFSCKVKGAMIRADVDSNATIKLITNDASTPLASVTWDSERRATDGSGQMLFMFTSEVTLSVNTDYRVIIDNSASATACTMTVWTVAAASHRGAWPYGETSALTTSNDGTTWTDTTTSQPLFALLVSALDDGVGGGGGLAMPVSGRICA